MLNMELIAKAEEQKRKIETALEEIRDTEAYVNLIEDNRENIRIVVQAGDKQVYLDQILTEELAATNRQMVLQDVDRCQKLKEDALERVLGREKEEKSIPGKEGKSGWKRSKSVMSREEEEKMIRELYEEKNLAVSEIAEKMGLTATNIYDRMKRYNIPVKNKKQKKMQDREKIRKEEPVETVDAEQLKMKRVFLQRLQDGATVHELAAEFKVSKTEMFQKLSELGIRTKTFRPR
jgi:predicted DNA-binding protein YlxM (UPF0122 family)